MLVINSRRRNDKGLSLRDVFYSLSCQQNYNHKLVAVDRSILKPVTGLKNAYRVHEVQMK